MSQDTKILSAILREVKLLNKNMKEANRIMLKWKGQDKFHHIRNENKLDAIKGKGFLK